MVDSVYSGEGRRRREEDWICVELFGVLGRFCDALFQGFWKVACRGGAEIWRFVHIQIYIELSLI